MDPLMESNLESRCRVLNPKRNLGGSTVNLLMMRLDLSWWIWLDQCASASGHGIFKPSDDLKVAMWDLCNLDRFHITKVKLASSIGDEV